MIFLLIVLLFPTLSSSCFPTLPYDNTFLPANSDQSQSIVQSNQPVVSTGSSSSEEIPQQIENIVVTIPYNPIETTITSEVKTNITEKKTAICPPSWSKFLSSFGYTKCYKKINGDFDYFGAKQSCKEIDGFIVIIETREEFNFLKNMSYTGMTLYLESVPYIGLIRNDVDGLLKWADGESEGFVKFYGDQEPGFEDGSCFKFVTDQAIWEGRLLFGGQKDYYFPVDCLHPSTAALCQIVPK